MKKGWDLTQEAFDALLEWLDKDREMAALEYLRIRGKLIRIFLGRGCPVSEELTDETINRVTRRVPELGNYEGDKALYFFRVAHFVYLEWIKEQKAIEEQQSHIVQSHLVIDDGNTEEKEIKDQCLQRCLAELPEKNRDLFLDFYLKEKRAKVGHRITLANQLGITINALRIRIHRTRTELKQCMTKCLEEMPAH